jgi:alkylation response protein AidB-like acyl-CoA dehydrogenase
MSEGAKYTLLGATIDRGEGNPPDLAVALPELSTPGLKLMYNWDAMGLRGTASHDVSAERCAPAQVRGARHPQPIPGDPRCTGAGLGRHDAAARAALGIPIWLGLAQSAFDFTIDYVKHRYGYLAGPNVALGASPTYRSEQAWAQMGIGNMEHWLETGRIVLYDAVRRLDTPFPSAQEFIRYLVRAVYHLRRMGEEVAQGAMRVCGAHAYVRNRPLERIFRDMVGGNVMAWKTDELMQSLGMGALGMPITFVGPAGT